MFLQGDDSYFDRRVTRPVTYIEASNNYMFQSYNIIIDIIYLGLAQIRAVFGEGF